MTPDEMDEHARDLRQLLESLRDDRLARERLRDLPRINAGPGVTMQGRPGQGPQAERTE